ncbi:MAG: hypothetical protein R3B72_36285 [Polyangiaceae bacterium]
MRDGWSFLGGAAGACSRNVKKVPFVELFGGRVQGVVSSGSDVKRVYVSFMEARTGNFYCSTNNNRPCGGLGGSPCKHISQMVVEASGQFGAATVAGYLGLPASDDDLTAQRIQRALGGRPTKEQASRVFSRFLAYLRYTELAARPGLVTEMSWFG